MKRALLIVLLLAGCRRTASESPTVAPPDAPARAAILAQLRDPDGARFGPFERGRNGATCGTVNAHNGFGGYTGPRPFAWSASTGPILYEFDGELGSWRERGEVAERFAALGCSIGADQGKAIAALQALRDSERRVETGR
jgi:hypothetical protein